MRKFLVTLALVVLVILPSAGCYLCKLWPTPPPYANMHGHAHAHANCLANTD